MSTDYSGNAVRLSPTDIADVAAEMGVEPAAISAVLIVETGSAGGYLKDGTGRMNILFEAKVFSDLTDHKFDADYPTLSVRSANWKLYKGGSAEYDRLNAAAELDADAAPCAASWGLFQIMGENHKDLGFATVGDMIDAFKVSERAQLEGFVAFCHANGLVESLADHDWATFARRYNGPSYAVNSYDTKLATAYNAASGIKSLLLRLGDSGPRVTELQTALTTEGYTTTIDGEFGRTTELRVMALQDAQGLAPDGIVGTDTLKALGL